MVQLINPLQQQIFSWRCRISHTVVIDYKLLHTSCMCTVILSTFHYILFKSFAYTSNYYRWYDHEPIWKFILSHVHVQHHSLLAVLSSFDAPVMSRYCTCTCRCTSIQATSILFIVCVSESTMVLSTCMYELVRFKMATWKESEQNQNLCSFFSFCMG